MREAHFSHNTSYQLCGSAARTLNEKGRFTLLMIYLDLPLRARLSARALLAVRIAEPYG
jgi:hypothetical protein